MNDEFYIGWQGQAPKAIASHVHRTVILLLLLAPLLGVLFVLAQRTIGKAVFEWGTIKTFSGILQARPYPHLLVARPGKSEGTPSAYYLVAPFKERIPTFAVRIHGGRVLIDRKPFPPGTRVEPARIV